MKREGILGTENAENAEVGAVSSGRSVVNTEDLPDGFKMTELGPLPKEWRVVRLGEVAIVGPPRIPRLSRDAIPFIPMALIPEGGHEVSQYELRAPSDVRSGVVVLEGDLLLAKITPCLENGKQGIVKRIPNGWGYATTEVFPIRTNEQLKIEFLNYYLLQRSVREALASKMEGTTGRQRLPKAVVIALPIPLPPLDEQRAIAHVLRTVQRAKEATEGVIAALKELKKSLMQHLFTYGPVPVTERERVPLQETELGPIPAHWRVVRLGEVVEKTKQIDPRKKPEWFFKYVDVSSVDNELLRITSYQNFAGKEAPSRARKQIDAGDVLFATVRPYLKRIAIVPPELEGHICSTAFCVLRAKNEIDACYLFFAVAHEPFVQRVAEHQRGSSYPAVTDQDVLREVIPLPPLDEQREIARMLQAVDAKIAAEQARRAALEEVFKTLLHQLMTGKVRVKGFHLPELE
jgi:type I restriction enzyme S subunit